MKNQIICLVVSGLFCIFFFSCAGGSGKKIITGVNGCSIFDPAPVSGQVLSWVGECKKNYASGYGTLLVYEKGEKKLSCEGNMIKGRLCGTIIFSTYKDEKIIAGYEEQWIRGYPAKRLKNLTFGKIAENTKTAREYLFLLAKYRKENPKAWLSDFHETLLCKIVFVCSEIISGSIQNKKTVIPQGELLLTIQDETNPGMKLYTVYNHRVSALKNLKSSRYIPGGRQFLLETIPEECEENYVPDTLPAHPFPEYNKHRIDYNYPEKIY